MFGLHSEVDIASGYVEVIRKHANASHTILMARNAGFGEVDQLRAVIVVLHREVSQLKGMEFYERMTQKHKSENK